MTSDCKQFHLNKHNEFIIFWPIDDFCFVHSLIPKNLRNPDILLAGSDIARQFFASTVEAAVNQARILFWYRSLSTHIVLFSSTCYQIFLGIFYLLIMQNYLKIPVKNFLRCSHMKLNSNLFSPIRLFHLAWNFTAEEFLSSSSLMEFLSSRFRWRSIDS